MSDAEPLASRPSRSRSLQRKQNTSVRTANGSSLSENSRKDGSSTPTSSDGAKPSEGEEEGTIAQIQARNKGKGKENSQGLPEQGTAARAAESRPSRVINVKSIVKSSSSSAISRTNKGQFVPVGSKSTARSISAAEVRQKISEDVARDYVTPSSSQQLGPPVTISAESSSSISKPGHSRILSTSDSSFLPPLPPSAPGSGSGSGPSSPHYSNIQEGSRINTGLDSKSRPSTLKRRGHSASPALKSPPYRPPRPKPASPAPARGLKAELFQIHPAPGPSSIFPPTPPSEWYNLHVNYALEGNIRPGRYERDHERGEQSFSTKDKAACMKVVRVIYKQLKEADKKRVTSAVVLTGFHRSLLAPNPHVIFDFYDAGGNRVGRRRQGDRGWLQAWEKKAPLEVRWEWDPHKLAVADQDI
ncbi:hypothetical protein BDZ91DRAFT_763561 [Kalaharituber pfeilii]|nr:hypothetical protein BDZ91DRAFT_763561 [Kalaharituber pfeilii]